MPVSPKETYGIRQTNMLQVINKINLQLLFSFDDIKLLYIVSKEMLFADF